MKILVTGSNGFIGKGVINILKNLVQDLDFRVVATDINDNSEFESNTPFFDFIKTDLFSIEDPYNYFGRPDLLIHLAWRDGFVHYSDTHIRDLYKHYMFIKKLCKSGIKQMVVLGTMHEIGFYEGEVNDQTPCRPTTPYGISKNALRELSFELSRQYNVNLIWVRGFYIVSNTILGSSVFSKLMKANSDGKESFGLTLGTNKFDFIDYNLFCRYLVLCTLQDKITGIVNICSGEPISLRDKIESFVKENDLKIKLDYGSFPERENESKAIWGDVSKLNAIRDINKDSILVRLLGLR